jgi:hypothetical protein
VVTLLAASAEGAADTRVLTGRERKEPIRSDKIHRALVPGPGVWCRGDRGRASGSVPSLVIHYSINVPLLDDWTAVPSIHAALHGHPTLSALWAQHNENRMPVPNVAYVGLAALSHDKTEVMIAVSAVLFVATFVLTHYAQAFSVQPGQSFRFVQSESQLG